MKKKSENIAIIGLGYVGLPLAVTFAKKYKVLGYDIDNTRIKELGNYNDKTLEVTKNKIIKAKNLSFTNKISDISGCNIFIITVPTPINKKNLPNLNAIKNATKAVAKIIKKGDFIIYESTVYPGVTEEVCVPILEKISKFQINKDFYCGYSPERINPGDKKYTIDKIVKVTSGSNNYSRIFIDNLYKTVISAGTYSAPNIKTAEAAKVIENTQRDINIALINELSVIFDKLNIDTYDVLDAAKTKWNFLNFNPGLVGGHCIGVDPYYLTFKAKKVGVNPNVILSGRKINNLMPVHVVKKLLKKMSEKKIPHKNSKILVMGLTFKENCPDIRNTKVFNIIDELKKITQNIEIYDSFVDRYDLPQKYKKNFVKEIKLNFYDCIILAVPHRYIKKIGIKNINSYVKKKNIIFDLKNIFKKSQSDLRL